MAKIKVKNVESSGLQIKSKYSDLIGQIGGLLQQGRKQAAYTVNNILVKTYWNIGRYIVEYEQGGSGKSEYGSKLLDRLSEDLTAIYGRGFSRSNLMYIRKLYLTYQISETVFHLFENTENLSLSDKSLNELNKKPVLLSDKLHWGHYFQILKADNSMEISFYTKQCEKENWSVRELKRQMNSMLFHRLALSKDKAGVLALAEKGAEIQKPEDILGAYKDRVVVEYALDNIDNKLFVSKYQLYLPEKELLQKELEKLLLNDE